MSLPAFDNIKSSIDWNQLINKQVDLVLDALFFANDTKTTFFIVGEIAKRNPQLIKKIEQRGHQIGSHSYIHAPINKLTKIEFENDLENSIDSLNKLIEKKVNCYRAPIWSYKKEMVWFWDILKKNNILYDSSIFPINKLLYGDPTAKRFIHSKNNGIIEIPPTTFRLFGINLPISGGIYFRFIPYFLVKIILKNHIKKYKKPIVMYFHPWELDPNPIKVKKISKLFKFVLYHNSKNSLKNFNQLINDFPFTSIDEYYLSKKNEL